MIGSRDSFCLLGRVIRACRRCPGRLSTVVCILAVFLRVVAALADDGPFGLPAPHDKNLVGSVMLHGGGHGLREEIREEFARLAGGKDARIL